MKKEEKLFFLLIKLIINDANDCYLILNARVI